MFALAGRTGIVTGGSSGIGLAAANVLAAAGAKVTAVSRTGRLKVEGPPLIPAWSMRLPTSPTTPPLNGW